MTDGISTRDLTRWLKPWPIGFGRKWAKVRWSMQVRSISWCARNLYSCWYVGKQRRTIDWWAKQCNKGKSPSEQHMIHGLARNWAPVAESLMVVAIRRDGKLVAYDGNHRLTAARLVSKYHYGDGKLTCRISHVMLLTPRESTLPASRRA